MNLKQVLGISSLKLKKHSPEILVVTGVVGLVGSGVMACKATLKLNPIIQEFKETKELITAVSEDEEFAERYSKEDQRTDIIKAHATVVLDVAKLYGPSIGLAVVSVGCIFASNATLRKRNIALAAAYATIDKSFKEYRKRVIDKVGEEVEREIRYNVRKEEITETITNENGKKVKVKTSVNVIERESRSPYSKFFDATSKCWEKDPETNLMFLRAQEQYANDLLVSRGYLFLNEVYNSLDIPITTAGQSVGWIYDYDNPIGDNYVDFGIYDFYTPNKRFVNGYEPVILLDFNVDGNILDYI